MMRTDHQRLTKLPMYIEKNFIIRTRGFSTRDLCRDLHEQVLVAPL